MTGTDQERKTGMKTDRIRETDLIRENGTNNVAPAVFLYAGRKQKADLRKNNEKYRLNLVS